MALTWYLLQTVFGIWMFYGFAPGPALMGELGAATLMALAFVGFVVQIVCRASLVEVVPIWSCGMVVAKSNVLEVATIKVKPSLLMV